MQSVLHSMKRRKGEKREENRSVQCSVLGVDDELVVPLLQFGTDSDTLVSDTEAIHTDTEVGPDEMEWSGVECHCPREFNANDLSLILISLSVT